jgi:hypothetical protein
MLELTKLGTKMVRREEIAKLIICIKCDGKIKITEGKISDCAVSSLEFDDDSNPIKMSYTCKVTI